MLKAKEVVRNILANTKHPKTSDLIGILLLVSVKT